MNLYDNKKIEESHLLDNNDDEHIFRLFACGPPSKISLESNEIKDYNEFVEQMLRNKADNGESRDDPDHIKRINSVAVTFEQIIQESKIPWERHFIPNKVLNVPCDEKKQRVKPKRRKSKRKRDAEKKVKKKNHGGNCPGWPTGGKGYAYGWRSNVGTIGKICISSEKNFKSFREKRPKSKAKLERNMKFQSKISY
ncbi:hypothetical protein GLOIN_2v1526521 [Rhizophagus clarus]|uniref:Uncharacterized protein n=1 Tax=Rhizophagus clarus TaxID=94130 RepID=A0A8H3QNJ6_9GLOM|nr:hypothetical protein GLOIN_2v1526521 [Rhizophagus clarus]